MTLGLWLGLTGCGGNSPAAPQTPSPPPPTLPPATLNDLSAAVTSPEADRDLNCREAVHARVTLTNRAASPVLVTGVRKTNPLPWRGCVSRDITYATPPRFVGPNSTSVVMDQALYGSGSGCCQDPRSCAGYCDRREVFEVMTDVGSVPAGLFYYTVHYSGCEECALTTSTGSLACVSAFR